MSRRKFKSKKCPVIAPDCATWIIPKVSGWLKKQRETAEVDRERRKNNLNEIHLNYVNGVDRVPVKKSKPKKKHRKKILSKPYKEGLSKQFSKELRENATTSETILKSRLSKLNIQFTFQFAVNNPESFYIVDFYIHKGKICLEVDGGYHNEPEQALKDQVRDKFLTSKGYKVVRITNYEVSSLTDKKLLKLIS